jgi:hypothetical protein
MTRKHAAAAAVAIAALFYAAAVSAGTLVFQTLAAPVSVAAGAATAVGTLERKTVSVEGTFTATYQVQISLDTSASPAATSWQNEGAALTTAGTLEVTKPAAWVRLNCTAYTSGTPTARVAGVSRL